MTTRTPDGWPHHEHRMATGSEPSGPVSLTGHHGAEGAPSEAEPQPVSWRHRLLMLVCCIPMLVLVIALVASGTAGSGAIIFALLCVGMMAGMMFLMPGGHRH